MLLLYFKNKCSYGVMFKYRIAFVWNARLFVLNVSVEHFGFAVLVGFVLNLRPHSSKDVRCCRIAQTNNLINDVQ